MIEIDNSGGILTAIVRDTLEWSDYGRFDEIESLWLTPEIGEFMVETPLQLPRLRILYIANCRQQVFEMVSRDSMTNLEWFLVADAPESLAGIGDLGELCRLERLKIREQTLTAEVIDWIAQQEKLKALALTDTNASDMTIAQLGCRKHLRRLDVFRSEVSFSHRELGSRPFSSVRSLDISETTVSNSSVETMRLLFPALERLIALDSQLDIDGLKEIASWERLKVLASDTPSVDFDKHGDEFWDL